MANGYNQADFAVKLPNMFPSVGEVMQQGIAMQQREKERQDLLAERQRQEQIRQEDKDEMDLYRKTQMIQDLTDVSKYQTGESVADALGRQKSLDILKKWTNLLREKKLSFPEISGGIKSEISETVAGMNDMKNELKLVDATIAEMQKETPELDTESLKAVLRQDVLNRRVQDNTRFNLQPPPSQIYGQLKNPEFLSNFVRTDAPLKKMISAAKGDKVTVPVGTSLDNTEYEGTKKFWQDLGFDQQEIAKQGGFLPKGSLPAFKIRGEQIPAEVLKSSSNVPFNVVANDVFDQFATDRSSAASIVNLAKRKFGAEGYGKLNSEEKRLAQRSALYDYLQSNSEDFSYSKTNRPPVSIIKNQLGIGGEKDKGKEEPQIRDVYNEIERIVRSRKMGEGGKRLNAPMNLLSNTAQSIVLKNIKPLVGEDVTQADFVLKEEDNGRIAVYSIKGETDEEKRRGTPKDRVAYLDELDVNLPAQVSVKEKREAVRQSEKPTQSQKQTGTIRVSLNGQIGEIPAAQFNAFMKKYPSAKKL